ncbi:uncharacterized protein N7503_010321 [Penicillium pulvis]|uniref:uncharacterized protein n=1 Tax=Penicillium pulvis TaxID=1562058 RepID=UPI002548D521|nr:uncharacterized protein N7503_010321 [Penicillium pulvis]KAJ5785109.1 hypothetical protein N7503_010321 [Penicillium pulvis]
MNFQQNTAVPVSQSAVTSLPAGIEGEVDKGEGISVHSSGYGGGPASREEALPHLEGQAAVHGV